MWPGKWARPVRDDTLDETLLLISFRLFADPHTFAVAVTLPLRPPYSVAVTATV